MAETVEELTPLKKKLDEFGTFLSKVRLHASFWLIRSLLSVQGCASRKILGRVLVYLPICSISAEFHTGQVLMPYADRSTSAMQVIAVICVLVWVINIPRFADPVHGNWVSSFAACCHWFHRPGKWPCRPGRPHS